MGADVGLSLDEHSGNWFGFFARLVPAAGQSALALAIGRRAMWRPPPGWADAAARYRRCIGVFGRARPGVGLKISCWCSCAVPPLIAPPTRLCVLMLPGLAACTRGARRIRRRKPGASALDLRLDAFSVRRLALVRTEPSRRELSGRVRRGCSAARGCRPRRSLVPCGLRVGSAIAFWPMMSVGRSGIPRADEVPVVARVARPCCPPCGSCLARRASFGLPGDRPVVGPSSTFTVDVVVLEVGRLLSSFNARREGAPATSCAGTICRSPDVWPPPLRAGAFTSSPAGRVSTPTRPAVPRSPSLPASLPGVVADHPAIPGLSQPGLPALASAGRRHPSGHGKA